MDEETFGNLVGIVDGHTNRIKTCEDAREDLFGSRDNHEIRLTKIETWRKAEAKYDGNERRGRNITFSWIINIVMALITMTAVIISYLK